MSIVDRVRTGIGARTPAFRKLLPIVDPEGVPGEEFLEEVRGILASKQLTNGAYVRKFEEAAAEYLGVCTLRGGFELYGGVAAGFEGFGFARGSNSAEFYVSRYGARGGVEWIDAGVCGL